MKLKNIVVAYGAILLFLSCATNPFSGKKTMAIIPNSQLFPTAFQQYDLFLTENKVVTGTTDADDDHESRSTYRCRFRTMARCQWL